MPDPPRTLVHQPLISPAPGFESEIGRENLAGPPPRTKLQLYTCPTANRAFVAQLERAFEEWEPQIDLIIHVRGDRDCVGHLVMGNADVAIISSALSAPERARGLTDQVIAHHIVVPVVHKSNPVESVPIADFKLLNRGKISNWLRLGGKDLDIQAVCKRRQRVEDAADRDLRVSGDTRPAVLLTSPRDILAYVANHPRAFGLVPLPHMQGQRNLRALQLSRVSASCQMFEGGVWPLGTTIRAILPRNSTIGARAFLEFLKTDAARRAIRRELTLPSGR